MLRCRRCHRTWKRRRLCRNAFSEVHDFFRFVAEQSRLDIHRYERRWIKTELRVEPCAYTADEERRAYEQREGHADLHRHEAAWRAAARGTIASRTKNASDIAATAGYCRRETEDECGSHRQNDRKCKHVRTESHVHTIEPYPTGKREATEHN